MPDRAFALVPSGAVPGAWATTARQPASRTAASAAGFATSIARTHRGPRPALVGATLDDGAGNRRIDGAAGNPLPSRVETIGGSGSRVTPGLFSVGVQAIGGVVRDGAPRKVRCNPSRLLIDQVEQPLVNRRTRLRHRYRYRGLADADLPKAQH